MLKKLNVGIIGSGAVGSTTAYSLFLKELVSKIYFTDYNEDLAKGQAADLMDASSVLNSNVIVKQAKLSELKDFDIVVITASIPATKITDRTGLYEANKKLIKDITEDLIESGFKGIYIVASNPVDLMAKACAQIVKDPSKVIGTGTILDSARLKKEIAKEVNVDLDKVEAEVIGEHGSTAVSLFSLAKIDNVPLKEYIEENNINFDYNKVHENMKNEGYYIFDIKGATTFGIATSITKIIEAIALDTKEVLNVTTYIKDKMGMEDIYIPFPSVIGKEGIMSISECDISELEREQLIDSANFIKSFD